MRLRNDLDDTTFVVCGPLVLEKTGSDIRPRERGHLKCYQSVPEHK